MITKLLTNILSPRQWVNLLMIGLDGQSVSGYGITTTFSFPEEKRKEILEEVFG